MGRCGCKKKTGQRSTGGKQIEWVDINYLLTKIFGMSFDGWSEIINYRELDELMRSMALSMELSRLIPQEEKQTGSDDDFKKYMQQMGGVL